jgi:cathepsin L
MKRSGSLPAAHKLAALAALLSAAARADAPPREEATLSPEVKKHLALLRDEIRKRHYTFTVGPKPDERPRALLKAGQPRAAGWLAFVRSSNARGAQEVAAEVQAVAAWEKAHPGEKVLEPPHADCKSAPQYDLRKLGYASPVVHDQKQCNDCWAYTAVEALASNWAIRNHGLPEELSVQQLLDCSGGNECFDPGIWGTTVLKPYDYAKTHGLLASRVYPDAFIPGTSDRIKMPCGLDITPGVKGHVDAHGGLNYQAAAWGFVHPAGDVASVAEIKAALCEHGAISSFVLAGAEGTIVRDLFEHYDGGVFNAQETTYNGPNHAVAILGWNDAKKAWLIKNSWGTTWGENGGDPTRTRGYGWIAYGTNYIGYDAVWMTAKLSHEVNQCSTVARVSVERFTHDRVDSLPPQQQARIRSIARRIAGSFKPPCKPMLTIEIEAYADHEPGKPAAYHSDLGNRRAHAVQAAIAQQLGTLAVKVRFIVKSLGDSRLKHGRPATPDEHLENNRVVVSAAFGR